MNYASSILFFRYCTLMYLNATERFWKAIATIRRTVNSDSSSKTTGVGFGLDFRLVNLRQGCIAWNSGDHLEQWNLKVGWVFSIFWSKGLVLFRLSEHIKGKFSMLCDDWPGQSCYGTRVSPLANASDCTVVVVELDHGTGWMTRPHNVKPSQSPEDSFLATEVSENFLSRIEQNQVDFLPAIVQTVTLLLLHSSSRKLSCVQQPNWSHLIDPCLTWSSVRPSS